MLRGGAYKDINCRSCGCLCKMTRPGPRGGKGCPGAGSGRYEAILQPELPECTRVQSRRQSVAKPPELHYSSDHPMKKLDHKWVGPFTITKVISPAAIKLCLSAQEKNIHPVISVSIVCPYIILDSRFRWGKLWYLVKFIR